MVAQATRQGWAVTVATRRPFRLRNRVVQITMIERMAPADAPGCHPAAAHKAILIDGLIPILRAGRCETAARRQDERKRPLIDEDEPHAQIFHGVPCLICLDTSEARANSAYTSSASAANEACAAADRAVNSISHPGASWVTFGRIASRRRRLTRLRTTAPPTCLLTEKPIRAGPGSSWRV